MGPTIQQKSRKLSPILSRSTSSSLRFRGLVFLFFFGGGKVPGYPEKDPDRTSINPTHLLDPGGGLDGFLGLLIGRVSGEVLPFFLGGMDGSSRVVYRWFGSRWFGIRIRVAPLSKNPFSIGGSQESKPPTQTNS